MSYGFGTIREGSLMAPFGANIDGRTRRVRGYNQVYNARLDKDNVQLNITRMDNNPTDCYYKTKGIPMRPTKFPGHEAIGYAYEWTAVDRRAAWGNRLNPAPRNAGNMDSRVPVIPTLCGVSGKSPEDISERYWVPGVLDLPGRETPTDGGTIVAAGVITMNSNYEDLFMGDPIMVVPADVSKVGNIKAPGGNGANTQGRVPWVMRRYLPQREDFYDAATIRRVLLSRVLIFNTTTGNFQFRATPVASDVIEKNGNHQAKSLVECMRDYIRTFADTTRELTDVEALNRAISFCLLSGFQEQKLANNDWKSELRIHINDFINNAGESVPVTTVLQDRVLTLINDSVFPPEVAANAAPLGGGPPPAIVKNGQQYATPAAYKAFRDANQRKMLANNPVQQFMIVTAQKTYQKEACVKGIAITDIPRGTDGDVHLAQL